MEVEFKDLEDCFIFFREPKEAISICDILSNEGYRIYGHSNVESDCMNWRGFEYDKDDEEFVLSNNDSDSKFKIDYNGLLSILDRHTSTNSKRKKVKRPKEDPFDEETWWEKTDEILSFGKIKPLDFKNLKEYFIYYKSKQEAINIRDGLLGIGYKVLLPDTVGDPDWHNYKGFRWNFEFNMFFQSSRNELGRSINYNDFMNLIKEKRIKNTEIDPFDEENWGFEKESFSYNSAKIMNFHYFTLFS